MGVRWWVEKDVKNLTFHFIFFSANSWFHTFSPGSSLFRFSWLHVRSHWHFGENPYVVWSILVTLFSCYCWNGSKSMLQNGDGKKDDEHEFDYLGGSGKGPSYWGKINPEWKACDNGEMQSPIDLLHKRVEVLPNLGRLRRKYEPAQAVVKNRGHDIMVKFSISLFLSFSWVNLTFSYQLGLSSDTCPHPDPCPTPVPVLQYIHTGIWLGWIWVGSTGYDSNYINAI